METKSVEERLADMREALAKLDKGELEAAVRALIHERISDLSYLLEEAPL